MNAPRVRVLLYVRTPETASLTIEILYREISTELSGTPGLITNELLQNVSDPTCFVVMSEWDSMVSFQRWEAAPQHHSTVAAVSTTTAPDDVRDVHRGGPVPGLE